MARRDRVTGDLFSNKELASAVKADHPESADY